MKRVLIIAALAVVGVAQADTLLFDNVTNFRTGVSGAGGSSTSSTPNTFMGDGYDLIAGANSITGFDLFPVNLSGTNFTGLKINIFVWGSVNTSGTVNATTPAFSNLLGSYTATVAGTYNTGFYFPFETGDPGPTPGFTLGQALSISSNRIGLTFNYQGTTDGQTYNSVNSLTSLVTYGTPASVGSNVFDGYYRNANSETDGNFTSALRSFGQTSQSVGVRVYGTAVPEPASMAVLGIGALALLRRRLSRKA
ncbi:MAG TPA: PEP-CTERM sorting domain-containing protein [Fimbriimonadaceae bacterium]|nr:PEP-CTERM sorting domain-containing protein [Fimbriimonadaceae bacterium]